MVRDVSVDEAFLINNKVFVDVRSEGEYAEATIPGALNIPIFNDRERAIIGTLYKEQGPRAAKIKGLEIIGPKLPQMLADYLELKKQYQNIILFCWRGGMRSHSIATILDLMDLPTYRIIGGYKAYRVLVNKFLTGTQPWPKIVVLRGLTGVGKTEIIQGMIELGMPVIDLEGLANNKGSVFGAVGMAPPPSQKMFDSLLMQKLNEFADSKYILVECESKKIGRIYLPDKLMQGMKEGLQILAYDDLENRVQRIIKQYTEGGTQNSEQLKRAISCLENSLGKKKVTLFNEMVDKQEYFELVKYLLEEYYDPLYKYPDHPTGDYDYSVKSDNIGEAIAKIKTYLEEYFI